MSKIDCFYFSLDCFPFIISLDLLILKNTFCFFLYKHQYPLYSIGVAMYAVVLLWSTVVLLHVCTCGQSLSMLTWPPRFSNAELFSVEL